MRIAAKILLGLLFLVLLAGTGAYVWFWASPVGINNLVNKQTLRLILDSPETLTGIGLVDNTLLDFHSGRLGSRTREKELETLELVRQARRELDDYGPDGLEGQELLTWKIMVWFYEDRLREGAFEHAGYRVNQISGVTVSLPQFLTDMHNVVDERSARRYVSRLNEFGRVLREERARVEDDRAHGVIPPDFIVGKALAGMNAFIAGGAAENSLVTTFEEKLAKLHDLKEAERAELAAAAKRAVSEQVIPGYQAMIGLFEELARETDHHAGIWRVPDGDRIYAAALKSSTTTDLTAEEIHRIGLSEVARIEGEMEAILAAAGYTDGSLAGRIEILMRDPAQQFPDTEEGRQELLAYLRELKDGVMARAGDVFLTLPAQPLEIVRVPEYSEDSAPGGYYNAPALDGSRPGRFYINLKDTADHPRWTLPTLLYHEAVPGHHFQLSAAQLVEDVPFFRRLSPFSAYTEGWALYAERLVARDLGVYKDDPLGDLGRLQAEMFRAVRLVVDTGMHHKRWSRERAIDYMLEKTGMTEAEVTREIERYVVWPGQATAYKIGQMAILGLRSEAEERLGGAFDLREFHELVLLNGAMPLGILEETVRAWIREQEARG